MFAAPALLTALTQPKACSCAGHKRINNLFIRARHTLETIIQDYFKGWSILCLTSRKCQQKLDGIAQPQMEAAFCSRLGGIALKHCRSSCTQRGNTAGLSLFLWVCDQENMTAGSQDCFEPIEVAPPGADGRSKCSRWTMFCIHELPTADWHRNQHLVQTNSLMLVEADSVNGVLDGRADKVCVCVCDRALYICSHNAGVCRPTSMFQY